MKGFTLKFWLHRWLVCRWFHRQHRKCTPIEYYVETGMTWYCNRCYRMSWVHLLK